MVWIWDDTGQPGALNRLFTSLDPCSAPPSPTTSQCWSWRGPQHTYGFSSWTGHSSMPLQKSLNRAHWVLWHSVAGMLHPNMFKALCTRNHEKVWLRQSNPVNNSPDMRNNASFCNFSVASLFLLTSDFSVSFVTSSLSVAAQCHLL